MGNLRQESYIDCGNISIQWHANQAPLGIRPNIISVYERFWNHEAWAYARSKRNEAFIVSYTAESFANDNLYRRETINIWKDVDYSMNTMFEYSNPITIPYSKKRDFLISMLSKFEIPFNEREVVSTAWVASNCKAQNGRELFVHKLMRDISIDSYGSCLNSKTLAFNRASDIYKYYKFSIAIENSNCVDYVSEKPFEVFGSGSIPIVASKKNIPDYSRYFPDHSYIDALSFGSKSDLINHIEEVSRNQTMFESYHYFRTNYTRVELETKSTDELIRMLEANVPKNQNLWNYFVKFTTDNYFYCDFTNFLLETNVDSIIRRSVERRSKDDCLEQSFLRKVLSA
uniref:Fucosyltransferase n=1 Tax=Fundulus heteroclitus TaxID=8078 RepID=A0A146ULC0_FUNHE